MLDACLKTRDSAGRAYYPPNRIHCQACFKRLHLQLETCDSPGRVFYQTNMMDSFKAEISISRRLPSERARKDTLCTGDVSKAAIAGAGTD
jgi:hypothetical protein